MSSPFIYWSRSNWRPLKKLFKSYKDEVVSGHRAHSHYLGKGGDLKKFICELYGKNGSSGGKAGSMHLTDKKSGFILSSAIVGNIFLLGLVWHILKELKRKRNSSYIFW